MLKLKFDVFQDTLKSEKFVGHYPTVHCGTDIDKFVFVMKTQENWKYYSHVYFEDILKFAESDDLDPNQAFDMFVTNYCSNTKPLDIDFSSNQGDQSITDENPEDVLNPTTLSKQGEIDAGEDLIEEAEDYSGFLLNFFNLLEKKVLSAINSIDIEKSYTTKNFGEFLKNLFNHVNTIAFANQVRRYIKMDLTAGLESAEAELNMDIGYTDNYNQKMNQLASQQIDGYMINGKKWPGIKGVTKEIQADVIKTVQSGINAKKSITEIKGDIMERFDNFSDWRSEAIARTETNRIINEGKIVGYKESGLKGNKVWSTAIDNRTSDICRRLNGQAVDLDDDFVDPETRKRYSAPPGHPNCRSSVVFRPN